MNLQNITKNINVIWISYNLYINIIINKNIIKYNRLRYDKIMIYNLYEIIYDYILKNELLIYFL
jgi:hypothetical protein